MSALDSHVDTASDAFRENRDHMDGLVAELRERLAEAIGEHEVAFLHVGHGAQTRSEGGKAVEHLSGKQTLGVVDSVVVVVIIGGSFFVL